MNLKDEIVRRVKEADMSDFEKGVNEQAINHFITTFMAKGSFQAIKDERSRVRFLHAMMPVMVSIQNDTQKKAAILAIIALYDSIIRTAVIHRISEFLDGATDAKVRDNILKIAEMQTRMDKMKKEVDALENEVKDSVARKGPTEFVAILNYAADNWGTEAEKAAVRRIARKVNEVPIVSKK